MKFRYSQSDLERTRLKCGVKTKRILKLQVQAVLLCLKKKIVLYLWKKGEVTQEEYEDVARICRQKIRKAKDQLELNLADLLKIENNVFTNIVTAKGESPALTRQGMEHYHQGQRKGQSS